MKPFRIALTLSVCLFMSGCDHKYHATVKLDNLLALDSARFGHLNSPLLKIGDVINLDPTSKHGTTVAQVSASTVDAGKMTSFDSTIGNSISVAFSANVPQTVQVDLKTQIQNAMQLALGNPTAIEAADMEAVLNDPANAQKIGTAYGNAQANHQIIVVVTKLIRADDVKFQMNGATTVNGSVNVFKFGNYTLNVSFTQNAALHTAATNSAASLNTGMFFKVALVGRFSDRYVPQNTNDLSLADYSLSDAFHLQ